MVVAFQAACPGRVILGETGQPGLAGQQFARPNLRWWPRSRYLVELVQQFLNQSQQAKNDRGNHQRWAAEGDDRNLAEDVAGVPAEAPTKPFPEPHGKPQGHTEGHHDHDYGTAFPQVMPRSLLCRVEPKRLRNRRASQDAISA
jgi:hypothetical protein